MESKARLSSFEELPFSITTTAPVSDWRAAMRQFDKLRGTDAWLAWPLSGFAACIREALAELDKTHAVTAPEPVTSTDKTAYRGEK